MAGPSAREPLQVAFRCRRLWDEVRFLAGWQQVSPIAGGSHAVRQDVLGRPGLVCTNLPKTPDRSTNRLPSGDRSLSRRPNRHQSPRSFGKERSAGWKSPLVPRPRQRGFSRLRGPRPGDRRNRPMVQRSIAAKWKQHGRERLFVADDRANRLRDLLGQHAGTVGREVDVVRELDLVQLRQREGVQVVARQTVLVRDLLGRRVVS